MNQLQTINKNEVLNELPQKVIIERSMALFRNAIGEKNAVDIRDIWNAVYVKTQVPQKYAFMYMMGQIHKAISAMKRNTPYFIVGKSISGQYKWYVLKTDEELSRYRRQISSKIHALKMTEQKAINHVKESKWKLI